MKTRLADALKLSQGIREARRTIKTDELEGLDYEQTKQHELDLTRRLAAELQRSPTLRPDEIAEIRRNLLE